MSSTTGNIFKVTTWGESHGKTVGVVVDGVPSGIALDENIVQAFLDRRKPGASAYATKRAEADTVEICSGVFEGYTTGTPIEMHVTNNDQISKNYDNLREVFRPSHADYGFFKKYGIRDHRGGGRSSGRETLGRVAAGAVAATALARLGIKFLTYTKSIGSISIPNLDYDEIARCLSENSNSLGIPHEDTYKSASAYLDNLMREKNSAGGVAECVVTGVKAGFGSPVFDKLDARLANAVFSIGAVKAVEIGNGIAAARGTGAENNDAFVSKGGEVSKKSNNSGGIIGGITDGTPVIIRAAFKPTPSIASEQDTVNKDGGNTTICIEGRHDPVIVPRALVVVESMAAVVLLDEILVGLSSRIENVKTIYNRF
ncbi:chorismate synthase [Clostridia bacterium]|nr:chorismate synthase [Clostridia bacterium]